MSKDCVALMSNCLKQFEKLVRKLESVILIKKSLQYISKILANVWRSKSDRQTDTKVSFTAAH